MAANPAPNDRPLMDESTFIDNFSDFMPRQTYLCYEVEVSEGDSWTPVEEFKGFLRNQGANTFEPRHAELCFLDRIRSWNLDKEKKYRVTCFISWSPCPDCANHLVEFLGKDSHVKLHIFAARIHSIKPGYELGLRRLQAAGAQLAIMTSREFTYCWENFVDNQGQPFQPWTNLDGNSQGLSQRLKNILQNQEN